MGPYRFTSGLGSQRPVHPATEMPRRVPLMSQWPSFPEGLEDAEWRMEQGTVAGGSLVVVSPNRWAVNSRHGGPTSRILVVPYSDASKLRHTPTILCGCSLSYQRGSGLSTASASDQGTQHKAAQGYPGGETGVFVRHWNSTRWEPFLSATSVAPSINDIRLAWGVASPSVGRATTLTPA